MRKAAEKLAPISTETAQFDAQTLHKINFEIISRLLKIWREYKDRKENRLKIFNLGAKLHGMVIDSIKVDPDIQQLKQLHEMSEEFQRELELAKKNRLLGPGAREQIIAEFINSLPPELRNSIVAYGRERLKLQTQKWDFLGSMTEEEQAALCRRIVEFEKQDRVPIEEQVAAEVERLRATPESFDTGPDLKDLSKSSRKARQNQMR